MPNRVEKLLHLAIRFSQPEKTWYSYKYELQSLFLSNRKTLIVAKKNAEDDLRTLLENSADEPTLFSVKNENIKRLHELKNNSNSDQE